MPMAVGRWVRLAAAAAFLLGGAAAIASTAARSLDLQGYDALAQRISGGTTQQQWDALSGKMAAPKGVKALDAETLARLRAEAVRHPLSATPYFLAGASRKLSGDAAGGARLVDLSVRRDPRFLPPRYWRINYAAERSRAGDATDAVLRVIVLDPASLMRTIPMLVVLTRSPDSWPRIREALPTGEAWREIYYNQLVENKVEPSIVFSAIDAVRASSGKPPSVREQGTLLASMTQKGDFDRAYTAWLGWLPPDALGKVAYLYDGGFTGAPGPSPFNWTLSSSGDGAAVIDKDRGLRFDYSPNVNMQLAVETVLMPPGRYRLISFSALDQEISSDIPLPVAWQVMCLPKRNVVATLRLPNSAASKGVAGFFDITPECVAQTLSLEGLAMEYPVRAGGYVRSVAIEKAK
jgi:hypothetical protein